MGTQPNTTCLGPALRCCCSASPRSRWLHKPSVESNCLDTLRTGWMSNGGIITCPETATKAASSQMPSLRPPSHTLPSTTDSPSLPRTRAQISSIAPAPTVAPRTQAALSGMAKHSTCLSLPSLSATPSTALPRSTSLLLASSQSVKSLGCPVSTLMAPSVSRSPTPPGDCAAAWQQCGASGHPTCCVGTCVCDGTGAYKQCKPATGKYQC